MTYDPPPEDPLVKAQRLAAERDSIKVQQEGLARDTSRLGRVYGPKSLFTMTPGGSAFMQGGA